MRIRLYGTRMGCFFGIHSPSLLIQGKCYCQRGKRKKLPPSPAQTMLDANRSAIYGIPVYKERD